MNETQKIAIGSAIGMLIGAIVWLPFFSDESLHLGMFLDVTVIGMLIAAFAVFMLVYFRMSEWLE